MSCLPELPADAAAPIALTIAFTIILATGLLIGTVGGALAQRESAVDALARPLRESLARVH